MVLVAFLFTGATESKRRPGLVLLDTKDEDIIVDMITTQPAQTVFDIEIAEWQQAGLRRQSAVQLHKVNTLEKGLEKKRLVERWLGRLDAGDWARVRDRIQQIWSSI